MVFGVWFRVCLGRPPSLSRAQEGVCDFPAPFQMCEGGGRRMVGDPSPSRGQVSQVTPFLEIVWFGKWTLTG